MYPIRRHIAVWILCASLIGTAQAQPPARVTVPKINPPEAVPVKPLTPEMVEAQRLQWFSERAPFEVPELVVGSFVEGNFSTAAMGVAGADWKSPELPKLQAFIGSMNKRTAWRAHSNPDAGATTVQVRVGIVDETGLQSWSEETVVLRAESTKAGRIWRVVPEKPEVVFTAQGEAMPGIGLVRRIATYLAYPHEAYVWLAVRRSMNQVMQLGLGMMQYTFDDEGHYPPTVATFREKIMPYTHDEKLFTTPGDAAGHLSYNLNPELAGRGLADLQEPWRTVAIYLGHDAKLDFRFDGRTIVGFADGHVQVINAEQAKTLRWKP